MPASSSGQINPNHDANLNEEGRAIFQPINTSQIEMDNAGQDSFPEKDRRREDDGNDTNPHSLENGTYSQEDKRPA